MFGDVDKEIYRESLLLHERHRGKLAIRSKVPLKTRRDLSRAYTPGVAEVCLKIRENPAHAYRYSIKANTVAIVTDGSAVLGLGNIGGYAAIPVMEGKAILFKEFADIDAFPICFEGYHVDFIDDIRNISPVFGGINLEDIAAPKCFEVEDALQDLGIPVMHDDQHGTAVVVMAALLNACRVTGKSFGTLKVAMAGAGAAGNAIVRILRCLGYDRNACHPVGDLIVCDTKGIIHKDRSDLLQNKYKYIIAHETNRTGRTGVLADALQGSDVFIGVSAPGIVTPEMIATMNDDPVVFALANPVPEIMPDQALAAGASIAGSGRSDFPNQINNVLAFPGIFRGALDARATRITDEMKVAAATALAHYLPNPTKDMILPSALDRGVAPAVAAAVKEAAIAGGCIRILPD